LRRIRRGCYEKLPKRPYPRWIVRVLVVYGSTSGGTAGLAQMVAEAFVAQGILADLGDAADVDEIDGYDVVVIGGALYNGRWQLDATEFVERHTAKLRLRAVWMFSSGPLDSSASTGALAPVPEVQNLAKVADARGHMTFGGYLAKPRGGFLGAALAWGKPGDYRDPEQVSEWVRRIVGRIRAGTGGLGLPDLADTAKRVASKEQADPEHFR
jgi:menaquinone-dependent protoporphyrinogen oxidase